jgi:hypothetical protein
MPGELDPLSSGSRITKNEFILFHMIMKVARMSFNLKSMVDKTRSGTEIDEETNDQYEKALAELFEQAERFGTNG